MIERIGSTEAGPAVVDADRLLREFFETEMPDPWPRLNLPAALPTRHSFPRYSRNLMRFALAAAVILALIGYWSLAGLFPRDTASGTRITGTEISDQRLRQLSPVERQRTSSGKEAQLYEEDTPTSQVINIIGQSTS